MSSGNLHETVWKQEASVKGMLLDGTRSLELYHRILQGIISDDDFQIMPKAQSPEGWYPITSNFSSAVDAIDATECSLRWGFAEKPTEIPMISQPVDCRVKPVPLGQRMTSAEVYEKYTKMADPNKLFTFGAKYQEFQRKQLVFTLWKFNSQLWYAYLGVLGGPRHVDVRPAHPVGVWFGGYCVLVCE